MPSAGSTLQSPASSPVSRSALPTRHVLSAHCSPPQNWNLSSPDTEIHPRPVHNPVITTSLQHKLSTMPVSARQQPENTQQRWRYNASGQYVDMGADAAASWELARRDWPSLHRRCRRPRHRRRPSPHPNAPKGQDARRTAHRVQPPRLVVQHQRRLLAPRLRSRRRPFQGLLCRHHPLQRRDSLPAPGNALLAHPPAQGGHPAVEAKERPHSFSGGLSTADLRRLQQAGDTDHDRQQQQQQQQQWYRDNAEQLSYPSLSTQVHRPVPQQQTIFNYPANASAHQPTDRDREDAQLEYAQQQQQQQRNYGPVVPHLNQGMVMNPMPAAAPQFAQPRPTNAIPAMNYRQPPQRNFPPQAPAPAGLGYSGHTSHLSLGNTQQLYEMMMPPPPDSHHPAVARVQQQHNVFRATHHHSASDPSAALRDGSLALLGTACRARSARACSRLRRWRRACSADVRRPVLQRTGNCFAAAAAGHGRTPPGAVHRQLRGGRREPHELERPDGPECE